MNAVKIAKAIGDEHIGHVLIHYASSVKGLIQRKRDGSFRKTNSPAKIFLSIVEAIDDEQFKKMMMDEVNATD